MFSPQLTIKQARTFLVKFLFSGHKKTFSFHNINKNSLSTSAFINSEQSCDTTKFSPPKKSNKAIKKETGVIPQVSENITSGRETTKKKGIHAVAYPKLASETSFKFDD